MPNFKPVQSPVRALWVAGLVAFGFSQSVFGAAVSPSARVAAVQPTRVADLVLLDHGFDAGLRQGMVCRVTRGTTEIAEVLLVDLRPTCSSALILNVAARQSIRAGDTAAIKILKT